MLHLGQLNHTAAVPAEAATQTLVLLYCRSWWCLLHQCTVTSVPQGHSQHAFDVFAAVPAKVIT